MQRQSPTPGRSESISKRPPQKTNFQAQRPAEEIRLVQALRERDEAAFVTLVQRYQSSLLRLARMYVHNPATAQEVVQETWLGVLNGVDRFEARSSLKTWIFRILINRAQTVAHREARMIPFSAFPERELDSGEPSVDPDRFLPANHEKWPGHWMSPPDSWGDRVEERLLAREARAFIAMAVEKLPASQREVITLRDIEQWSSEEVCNALGISETNQRVLLHRARSKVRRVLENYFAKA